MKKFLALTTALFITVSCSNSTSTNNIVDSEVKFSKVRIVSLIPNPTGSDDSTESFTLKNLGNLSQDLTGWKIRDEEDFDTIKIDWELSGNLAPSQTSIINSNKKAELRNAGDTVYLVNKTGDKIQTVIFGKVDDGQVIEVKE